MEEKKVSEDKGKVLKKEKAVVLPGDKIVDSMDYLPGKNCFREGGAIISKRIGLVYFKNRVIEVIPLAGMYTPEPGDMIIGVVENVERNGWAININSPYEAFLPLSGVKEFIDPMKTDLSKIYGVGDVIYGKVSMVSPAKSIHISMQDIKTRKFNEGRIVKISPVKVPRLIGKQGSMINLVKNKTGCRISVGQNGMIWLQGDNEILAVKAIKTIDKKSHTNGLTDYIEKLLSKK
ncbi:MAG: RNA-binding protein [Candidatus Aenigmarchaeota archaeon]|nr:RNA-binding protein [Candidatus Aenigmarchaeota archaeon]